jgi:hypothetical protein
MNNENKSHKTIIISLTFFFFLFSFFFCSCDHGQLGNADVTDTYYPGNEIFDERLDFLNGFWSSRNGSRLLDRYQIRKWDDLTAEDKEEAQALFPSADIANLKTYATEDTPQDGDYVFLYDETVFVPSPGDPENAGGWGFSYMGVVRAVNIFNDDKKRGAVIIEYFEGADPAWLSDPGGYSYQGLEPGEKPYYGVYFKVIDNNTVQLANPVDLKARLEGRLYHTEQKTLQKAVKFFDVENEAEFISWGVVISQNRE